MKWLSTIQMKVNILTLTNTTLAAWTRICNSFLLSKLWHTLRLCPLPLNLQQQVIAIVNPFLFKGQHHWIKQEYVVAPKHLGGLGVIDTMQMGVALLGQMVAGLLASTEPIGAQFRQALQDHLWIQYDVLPAHFILKHGQPWTQMTHTTNASTTSTIGQTQANGTLATLTSNLEDTSDPVPVPLTKQHDDGGDEAMEDPYLAEPDQQAFQPIFTGHNQFVEITVSSDQLVILSEVSLVFNKTSLQCVLVGSALPQSSLALEILNIPQANVPTATAHYVAQSLKAYIQVHDVWIRQASYHNDHTPPADTNVYIALISTPAGNEGGLDPVWLHAIPGYILILTNDYCPGCLCHKSQCTRHIAVACPNASHDAGDTTAAIQQAEENASGASTLDYGA
ncbi:uncharacterized protein UBRO2_02346 [Ustilago bromivora]|uniref:Uncharacterized protein n=1 Tax=Ustilago bromivora TaxID=307758 RepID=A0A8H8QKR9_9BASI|nr:uncharacterized protein UBRO2_02346 [Ustilago bromivora]